MCWTSAAGTALTSIFLAREYDVEVWATDLWVDPTCNWERIQAAGQAGRIHRIHAEARELPFADGFFDAIVSIGAYHYFGTDVPYLAACSAFLRPGGSIGIIVPGLRHDPARIFRRTWSTGSSRHVQLAQPGRLGGSAALAGGLRPCRQGFEPDETMLRVDGGELLGPTRVVARHDGGKPAIRMTGVGEGDLMADEIHDPHIVAPGRAPTPFTADEIRRGCPVGRTIRLRVEAVGEAPFQRSSRFVECDEAGAVIERSRLSLDGSPLGEPDVDRMTWRDLQAHASFPAVDTTIETERIETAIGPLDCLRYTVRDAGTDNVFWFAKDLPGMPIQYLTRTEGQVVSTVSVVANTIP